MGNDTKTPNDIGQGDFCAESYDRWQRREYRREEEQAKAWRRCLLQRGDPDHEKVPAALEGGWDR